MFNKHRYNGDVLHGRNMVKEIERFQIEPTRIYSTKY